MKRLLLWPRLKEPVRWPKAIVLQHFHNMSALSWSTPRLEPIAKLFVGHRCLMCSSCMLATCSLHACVPITCLQTLRACRASVCMRKCQCRSVVYVVRMVEVSVCKCKRRSVSVQRIFRKNPSQCSGKTQPKPNPKTHPPKKAQPVEYLVELSGREGVKKGETGAMNEAKTLSTSCPSTKCMECIQQGGTSVSGKAPRAKHRKHGMESHMPVVVTTSIELGRQ